MNGVPDLLEKNLDVVFCGINLGLQAAAVGHHSSAGQRFWLVLVLAGLTSRLFDPTDDRLILIPTPISIKYHVCCPADRSVSAHGCFLIPVDLR
jgi:G:T/U-mismatch repair DNA glycosylase